MTDNDQRFATLAMNAANQRTHQMIEIAALNERIAALEAAARMVIQNWVDQDGLCWVCRERDRHANDCTFAALAALLEETA